MEEIDVEMEPPSIEELDNHKSLEMLERNKTIDLGNT